MTLDDVYGSENDRFPLEQEAALLGSTPRLPDWDEDDLGLIWDESEVQRLTAQFDKGERFDLH
jgi:hypothetical protein